MLQMVRTLAQFTIALEDMRDIGDGIDAAFATSGLSGAAEELPEKGCGSRGGTEVTAKGVPGTEPGVPGGVRGWDGGAGMRHVWTRVQSPAPVGSAPRLPWQRCLHPHPRLDTPGILWVAGRGDAPARRGGDGGAGAIAATAPPALIYTAEASLVGNTPIPMAAGADPEGAEHPGGGRMRPG